MKELDFTGEWLTKGGEIANVMVDNGGKDHKTFTGFVNTEKYGKILTGWKANGDNLSVAQWDLQKRLDGYTE